MIDFFGATGRAATRRLAAARTLFGFDFDGTLAPIVERPEQARAAPSTVALLASLGARSSTLLLTGRAVDDLRQRIAFEPTYLVGNHGGEGMPASLTDPEGLAASHAVVARWLSQWPRLIAATADPAIEVEPKTHSLSIHYRTCADHAVAARQIALAIEQLDPKPHVIGGKCVFNLLPEGAPNKGHALAALVAFDHCSAAFFIGDDLTDETVFEIAPPSWVTVRVGNSTESAARYFIADQGEIDRCLAQLVGAFEA